jgi:hypothetical protein
MWHNPKHKPGSVSGEEFVRIQSSLQRDSKVGDTNRNSDEQVDDLAGFPTLPSGFESDYERVERDYSRE